MTEPVLFDEPGSSWWPVLWGPVFALIGAGVEALGGRVHAIAWIVTVVLAWARDGDGLRAALRDVVSG